MNAMLREPATPDATRMRPATPDATRSQPGSPLDDRVLRGVLGCFPTGVTVVIAMTGQGPVGITANSFTSVSLDPPLVLWCIATASRRRSLIQAATAFTVNILSEDQEELTRALASHSHEPFTRVRIRVGGTGAPVLLDALAFVECRVVGELATGDHLVFLGEIVDGGILRDDRPLVFFRSAYTKLLYGVNRQRSTAEDAARSGSEDWA